MLDILLWLLVEYLRLMLRQLDLLTWGTDMDWRQRHIGADGVHCLCHVMFRRHQVLRGHV